jgi:UDP-glucuronate 4-epimerase
MTLLVTGAMGHLGYEIARQAVAQGHDVVAIYRDELRDDDAAALGPKVKWLACELTDAAAVAALARRHQIDTCIHAAAISNEAYARPNPIDAIASNVGATANLLDAARVAKWRRFVFVSTGSVFQKRADTAGQIFEDATPEPANIYSTTKYNAELLTRMYRSEFGLSASTVRISWVFGPPVVSESPARGPIPSYLLRAFHGETISEGGGDFAASFTYIADAAAGLLAAAIAPQLRFDTYHLGHGVNFTARQAGDAVQKLFPGVKINLGAGAEPWTKYTAIRGPLAGSRLRDDTGFELTHTLDQGIAAYAAWMRSNPAAWRAP